MNFSTDPDTFENRFSRATFDNGKYKIYAVGDITENSVVEFIEFVKSHKIDTAKVYLNSPGGSLLGGLRLGQAIRDLGFDTEIGSKGDTYGHNALSMCASACAYSFAGGVNRFYGVNAKLGIHQFYSGEGAGGSVQQGQVVSGIIVSYLESMGINASAFALSTRAGSDEMVWLTEEAAKRLGFVNDGTSVTTAEIKLAGMTPYLKLEQVRMNVTSRVLLFCSDKIIGVAAGVVTTPELSRDKAESVVRSYLEIDRKEVGPVAGPKGVSADGSVLWVRRQLDAEGTRRLIAARSLDAWTENGGAMRWGAQMDVSPVSAQIGSFVHNCTQ